LTSLALSPCFISSNLNSLAKLSVKSLHFPVLSSLSLFFSQSICLSPAVRVLPSLSQSRSP
jgi:hypothetical protein